MLDAIRVPCFAPASKAPMNATRVPFAGTKFARLGSPTETNRLEYGISVRFCAMKYTIPPEASAIPSPPLYRAVSWEPIVWARRERSWTRVGVHVFTVASIAPLAILAPPGAYSAAGTEYPVVASAWAPNRWSWVAKASQFVTFQVTRVGSDLRVARDVETRRSPVPLNPTWRTAFPKWPDAARRFPVAASTITTFPSSAATARKAPDGCHATSFTGDVYVYVRRGAPVADQRRTSPFALAVAIVFDADHAIPRTGDACGSAVTACVPRSKIFAVPSEEALAIFVPVGLNARSFTAAVWIVYDRSGVHEGTCHTSTEYSVRPPTSS